MRSNVFIKIPDDEFIRGDVPMTKEEVRTISLSKLKLTESSRLIDIGAGTGSVSIGASFFMPGGKVFAVEKKEEAVELINQNIEKFNRNNITVIHGNAPGVLEEVVSFDRVFIGGSTGKLLEILDWVHLRLPDEGVIVVNSITLETINLAVEFFKKHNYKLEIIQAAISKVENKGEFSMLIANNPVFIISGEKVES